MMRGIPTEALQQEMRNLFKYDPESGRIRWQRQPWRSKVTVGSIAGCTHGSGHISLSFKCKNYMAHHVAWFLHYGTWPTQQIYHRNGKKSDNRIENLATQPTVC